MHRKLPDLSWQIGNIDGHMQTPGVRDELIKMGFTSSEIDQFMAFLNKYADVMVKEKYRKRNDKHV